MDLLIICRVKLYFSRTGDLTQKFLVGYNFNCVLMLCKRFKDWDEDFPTAKLAKHIPKPVSNKDLTIGKQVTVRFGNFDSESSISGSLPILAPGRVMLTERFGVMVMVLEQHEELPSVQIMSKYWASWKGEMYNLTIPLLDVIHSA